MRYWTLEKGDVIGPFEPAELALREGFGARSLVCPESYGNDHSYWKEAQHYEDFAALTPVPAVMPAQTPAPAPAPSKDKDIEKYFNQVYKGSDSELSSILGIKETGAVPMPDPFEKTATFRLKGQKPFVSEGKILSKQKKLEPKNAPAPAKPGPEPAPPAAQTPPVKTQAPAPEIKVPATAAAQAAPLQEAPKPAPFKEPAVTSVKLSAKPNDFIIELNPITERVKQKNLKVFTEEEKAVKRMELKKLIDNTRAAPEEADVALKEEFLKLIQQKPKEQPLQESALSLTFTDPSAISEKMQLPFLASVEEDQTLTEPIKTVPLKELPQKQEENLGFDVEKTHLDAQPLTERTSTSIARRKKRAAKSNVFISMLIIFITVAFGAGALYVMTNKTAPAQSSATAPSAAITATAATLPPVMPAEPAAAVQTPLPPPPSKADGAITERSTAIAIAQNHILKKKNISVNAFLDSYFSQYLTQGYSAVWSSEPLHKDTYIVKYKLTKTRKEPIVYIFEVDVNKGVLTGALNNLTLDLLDM